MTAFDPLHRNWLHLDCTQSSPVYSMFLYLLCCFYFGKLISAGPPEMSGVLIRGERINMSGWVRERAVHVHLISSGIGWISKVSNCYLRQWLSLKSLCLLPVMPWWDLQHIWHKGGTSSLQMATVKTWMVKQLVATTAVGRWVFKLFDYITWWKLGMPFNHKSLASALLQILNGAIVRHL